MLIYTLTKRNVNTDVLCDEIENCIEHIFKNFSINWSSELHRTTIIEMIEQYLHDMSEDGKLTQWNVMCDHRNNPINLDNDIHLDIMFRQRNCFNETSLHFLIDA